MNEGKNRRECNYHELQRARIHPLWTTQESEINLPLSALLLEIQGQLFAHGGL